MAKLGVTRPSDRPDSRPAAASCFVLVLAAGVWAASRSASSGDLWVALGCGRYILSHGVTRTDPFSFTSPPGSWVNQNWLSHVFFTILHGAGGLGALGLWKIAVCVAIGALAASTTRALGAGRAPAALSAVAIAFVGRPFYDVRPNLHTILLGAVLIRWLVGIEERSWRRFWPVPLLMILWANLHGGFLFGVIALAAAVAALLAMRIARARTVTAWPAVLLLPPAGLLATLVSPYGITNLTHPYVVTAGPEGAHWRGVVEWLPPYTEGAWEEPGVRAFWILLGVGAVLGAASLLTRGRRPAAGPVARPSELPLAAVAMAGLFLSLMSRRFIPLFASAAIPILAFRVGTMIPRRVAPIAIAWPAAAALALAAAGADIAPRLLMPNALWGASARWPARLVRLDEQPEHAVRFLLATGFQGRVLTNWTWGGYLLYRVPFDGAEPRYRIYMDGRAQAAYPASISRDFSALVHAAATQDERSVAAFLDHYRIDACVLDPREKPLADIAPGLEGWIGVYGDDRSLIVVRAAKAVARPPADAFPDESIARASAAFYLRTRGRLTAEETMEAFQLAQSSARARPTTMGVTEMTRIALAVPPPLGETLRSRAAEQCDRILEGNGPGATRYEEITTRANTAQCRAAIAAAQGEKDLARRLRAAAAYDAALAARLAGRYLR